MEKTTWQTIFYLLQVRGPRIKVDALSNAFLRHKLTPHLFCETSSRQASNLTRILLNSVSGSKRGKRGTFHFLCQDHPEKKETSIKINQYCTVCMKVIGFASLGYTIGLKNRHFFIQSEVKQEQIETRYHKFSRALRQLHVITLSFDWLTALSVSLMIG